MTIMKNLRLVAFVLFAVCAFCLPAQAQKKWTYKGDDGKGGEITIIITQRPTGYEVSGDYKPSPSRVCKLRGSYLPAGQRLKATCEYDNGEKEEVTGSKQEKEDVLPVEAGVGDRGGIYGGTIVAKRVGAKPATIGSSTESSSSSTESSVVGTWKWAYAEAGDPQEHGTVTFNADGTMDWSLGSHGTWTQTGATVELHWDKKITDTMTLIESGKKLKGTNTKGWTVIGTR